MSKFGATFKYVYYMATNQFQIIYFFREKTSIWPQTHELALIFLSGLVLLRTLYYIKETWKKTAQVIRPDGHEKEVSKLADGWIPVGALLGEKIYGLTVWWRDINRSIKEGKSTF